MELINKKALTRVLNILQMHELGRKYQEAIKFLAIIFLVICNTGNVFGGTSQMREVNINDTFWLQCTSHQGVVGVTWTWDTDCFELISNLYATSGQAQFRAKKMTPASGAYIQAVTRYQINGASGSFTDYDDWRIVVNDKSTVSLPENLTLQIGDTYTLTAVVSTTPYNGDVRWESQNRNVVAVYGDNTSSVFLKAKAEGTAKVTATLQNGAAATCQVKVAKAPTVPEEGEYEIVDLGLSVNWASKNIGATTDLDYGIRFAWGETSPKVTYTASNSKNYNIDLYRPNDIVDNYILKEKYDAANKTMGTKWRMPTDFEFGELRDMCTCLTERINGQYVMVITGPSGKSIKLPFENSWWETRYWTSTSYANIYESNCCAVYAENPYLWILSQERYLGCYVRGVTNEMPTAVDEIYVEKPSYSIYVESNCIKIRSDVSVTYGIYASNGMIIAEGNGTDIAVPLASGIYLVRVMNDVKKVMVNTP